MFWGPLLKFTLTPPPSHTHTYIFVGMCNIYIYKLYPSSVSELLENLVIMAEGCAVDDIYDSEVGNFFNVKCSSFHLQNTNFSSSATK